MLRLLKAIRGARGMTITEAMFGAMALGVVSIAVYVGFGDVNKQRAAAAGKDAIAKRRALLVTTVNNAMSWKATLNGNPSALACLRNKTDCSAAIGSEVPISIYDSSGNELTSISNLILGFDQTAYMCTPFNIAFGNNACPFRYEATWSPICEPGNCLNPQDKITFTLIHKPLPDSPSLKTIEPARYTFTVLRGVAGGGCAETCAAMKGTFNASTKTCALPLAG